MSHLTIMRGMRLVSKLYKDFYTMFDETEFFYNKKPNLYEFYIEKHNISHALLLSGINQLHAKYRLPPVLITTSPFIEDLSRQVQSGFLTVVSDLDIREVVGYHVFFKKIMINDRKKFFRTRKHNIILKDSFFWESPGH